MTKIIEDVAGGLKGYGQWTMSGMAWIHGDGDGDDGENTLCNIISISCFYLSSPNQHQRMTLEDAHLVYTEGFGNK